MSILKRDAKLKSLSIAAGLLASCCLTVSLNAESLVFPLARRYPSRLYVLSR
jgi:hypothetical protein